VQFSNSYFQGPVTPPPPARPPPMSPIPNRFGLQTQFLPGAEAGNRPLLLAPGEPSADDTDDPSLSMPALNVSGTINVTLESGKVVEMDVVQYLDELRAEAEALRSELDKVAEIELRAAAKAPTTLAEFISQLPPDEKQALTEGIEPDTVEAMRRLVQWMIGEDTVGEPEEDGLYHVDKGSLASLCLWQLVLGYKLREFEATGEARDIAGR